MTKILAVFLMALLLTGCGTEKTGDRDMARYENYEFRVALQFPAEWKPVEGYENRYGGENGYIQLAGIGGTDLQLEQVARDQTEHRLSPYGSSPEIVHPPDSALPALLILPSKDQDPEHEGLAALVVRLPEPVITPAGEYGFLIVWGDKVHIPQLAGTLEVLP